MFENRVREYRTAAVGRINEPSTAVI